MCLLELWFSQGISPEVVLLDHMVALLLVLREISMSFPIVLAVNNPPAMQEMWDISLG